jgi:hypothetical protein
LKTSLESILAILIVYFGVTLLHLIRRLIGRYGGYEIDTLWDVLKLTFNPFNWVRLYRAFFYIAEEQGSHADFYRRLIISNIASYILLITIAILISRLPH